MKRFGRFEDWKLQLNRLGVVMVRVSGLSIGGWWFKLQANVLLIIILGSSSCCFLFFFFFFEGLMALSEPGGSIHATHQNLINSPTAIALQRQIHFKLVSHIPSGILILPYRVEGASSSSAAASPAGPTPLSP